MRQVIGGDKEYVVWNRMLGGCSYWYDKVKSVIVEVCSREDRGIDYWRER